MKYLSAILIFSGTIFLFAFTISKEKSFKEQRIYRWRLIENSFKNNLMQDTAKKDTEILFDYPDDILEKDKPAFEKSIKKGKILYEINCERCHSPVVNGDTIVPDFSLPQLMDYEVRIQYPAHGEVMRETDVSVEELDVIVDFLRYKKRSGVPPKL